MLGFVLSVLFGLGAVGLGLLCVGRFLPQDRAARFGLAGIIGLGALGTLTYVLGMLAGWPIAFMLLGPAVAYGLYHLVQIRSEFKTQRPTGNDQFFVLSLGLLGLLALIGVVAPSTSLDWDSLAYQMAVPKIWLAAGRVEFISYIHHSNFPAAVNSLFVWGLMWGGQIGAKTFCLLFFGFGITAVFGLGRQGRDNGAGWWSALAFAAMPVVCWEGGTAYVDVANGLFLGLGIWLAARAVINEEQSLFLPAALLWGFAIGSKYTALPSVAVAGIVLLALSRGKTAKPLLLAGLLSLLIGCPAYIRNVVNTGNPVYPYLYSKLGGKNWDSFSDQIYREEQATFGVGRGLAADQTSSLDHPLQPMRVGAAILGLGFEPGRFTNPQPRAGAGFANQAIGFGIVTALLVVISVGRSRSAAWAASTISLLCLLMWFALSQQSRYIVGFFVPASIAISTLDGLRQQIVRVAVGIQFAVTGYIIYSSVTTRQVEILAGKSNPPSFSKVAEELNSIAKGGRVALFEEVFGFYLDVPYFWASPGHTTELGYAELKDGDGLANALKRVGCTHAYLKLSSNVGVDVQMAEAMQSPSGTIPDLDTSDIRNKWRALFVDAVHRGRLTAVKPFGSGVVFQIH